MDERDMIAGAAKVLAVIEAFDEDHARMTPSIVAARTTLTRTSARRYLLTLAAHGYVESDGKQFWLAPRVLRLGTAFFASARLPRLALPFLQRITAAVHESALLAVLDSDDVVYIARNAASRATAVGFVMGSRVAAPLSSAGMVLLAHEPQHRVSDYLQRYKTRTFTPYTVVDQATLSRQLADVLKLGYMLSEQQLEPGMRGVSVPVRDRTGQVIAAIGVSMPIGQESGNSALARTLPTLLETAGLLRSIL